MENNGMGKIGGIILAAGLLLMLGGCSGKALAAFMTFGLIVAGIGVVLLVIFIIGLALKNTNAEAKANATTTGVVTGTSTSQRKGASTGTSTSQRLAGTVDKYPQLKTARQTVMDEKFLANRINDTETREAAGKVLAAADKVIDTLATKPEKISTSTSYQFLNYYLPTLGVILKKFKALEDSGVDTGNTKDKVVKYMNDIEGVMAKQYQTLFDEDILDLAVEMEAMTIACKRDGLLSEEDVIVENGQQVVKLSI